VRINPFHTTTFRLTVLASLVFVLLSVGGLRVLYWSMHRVFDTEISGALDREFVDMNVAFGEGGYEALSRTVADRASPHDDALRLYLLQGPDGTLTGNLTKWPADAPVSGKVADIAIDHAATNARVRVLSFNDGSRLMVGRSLSERDNFIRIFNGSAAGIVIADLLLGIAVGVFLARYGQNRLSPINVRAEEVLSGKLSGRTKVIGEGGDEYYHLARNINAMLARIEQLVDTVRGVTENIAHDLRTPLNRLRGRLEVALMADRSGEEYRAVLNDAIAQTDGIVETFNGILKIARIESGTLKVAQTPVDLSEIVEELVDLFDALAEDAEVTVEARLGDTPESGTGKFVVFGDAHLISQAAANLLDNAIKYSPKGGTVTITAAHRAEGVGLAVSDQGPGIPLDKRAAILERFVRYVANREKQGFGLGLSFVAAVARWHGAKLLLEDNKPGLRVTLLFPTNSGEQS